MKLTSLEIDFEGVVQSLIREGFVRDDAIELAMLMENRDRGAWLLQNFGIKVLQRYTREHLAGEVPPQVMTELGTIEPVGFLEDALIQDGPDDEPRPDPRPGKLIAYILAHDPTQNKGYARWIATRYVKGEKIEDINQMLTQQLSMFQRAAQARRIENGNLDTYKSFADLFVAVEPFVMGDREVSGRQDRKTGRVTGVDTKKDRQWGEDDPMRRQAQVVYDGDDYMILIPKTAEAATYFGKNTNWCTTSGHFDYYSKQGPLIIILRRKDGRRWQFHFESNQFMDERNHRINLDEFFDENPKAVQAIGLDKFTKYIGGEGYRGSGIRIGARHFPPEILEKVPENILARAVMSVADLAVLPQDKVWTEAFFQAMCSSEGNLNSMKDKEQCVAMFYNRLTDQTFWEMMVRQKEDLIKLLPKKAQTDGLKIAAAKGMTWMRMDDMLPKPWPEEVDEVYWNSRCNEDSFIHATEIPKQYQTKRNLARPLALHPEDMEKFDLDDVLVGMIVDKVMGRAGYLKDVIKHLPKRFLDKGLHKRIYDKAREFTRKSEQDTQDSYLETLALFPESLWPWKASAISNRMALINPEFYTNPEQFQNVHFAVLWAKQHPYAIDILQAKDMSQEVVEAALLQYPKPDKPRSKYDPKPKEDMGAKASFFRAVLQDCDPKIVKPEYVAAVIPKLGNLEDVWAEMPKDYISEAMRDELLKKGFIPFGNDLFKGHYTGANIAMRFARSVPAKKKVKEQVGNEYHRYWTEKEVANTTGMKDSWDFLPAEVTDDAKKDALKSLFKRGYLMMTTVVEPALLNDPDVLMAWVSEDAQKFRHSTTDEKSFKEAFKKFPETAYTSQNMAVAVKTNVIKEVPDHLQDDDVHVNLIRNNRYNYNGDGKPRWDRVTKPILLKAIALNASDTIGAMGSMPKDHPLLKDKDIALAFLKKTKSADSRYTHSGDTASDDSIKRVFEKHHQNWDQACYDLAAGNIIPLKEIPKKFWSDAVLSRAIRTDVKNALLVPDIAQWLNNYKPPEKDEEPDNDYFDREKNAKTMFEDNVLRFLMGQGIVHTPKGWVDMRGAKKVKVDGSPGAYAITKLAPQGEALLIFDDKDKCINAIMSGIPRKRSSWHRDHFEDPAMFAITDGAWFKDDNAPAVYNDSQNYVMKALRPYRLLIADALEKHPEFTKQLPLHGYNSGGNVRWLEDIALYQQGEQYVPVERMKRTMVESWDKVPTELTYVCTKRGSGGRYGGGSHFYMFDGQKGAAIAIIDLDEDGRGVSLNYAKMEKRNLPRLLELSKAFSMFLANERLASGQNPKFKESALYTDLGVRGPGKGEWFSLLDQLIETKGPLRVWRREQRVTITHDKIGVLVSARATKEGFKREYESPEINNFGADLEGLFSSLKSKKK